MAKRNFKSITGGGMSYRQEKGYSRLGGVLKSKEEKGALESKAKRANAYSVADNKKVATAMGINNQSKKAIDDGLKLNDHGIPDGDQKHKKFKKLARRITPKFRHD